MIRRVKAKHRESAAEPFLELDGDTIGSRVANEGKLAVWDFLGNVREHMIELRQVFEKRLP